MASIGDMVAYLRLDSKGFTKGAVDASRSTNQLNARFGVMARSAGQAALALTGIGSATAVAAASLSRGVNFERTMARSLAIQTTSLEQQERMREEALAVGEATQFSAKEAAEAYFFLASAGLTAEQQIASLETVAKFAQAGNFDLALATDLLTDAQSAMGLSSDDAAKSLEQLTRVGDVLVKANTMANASVQQFATSLTSGAAASAKDAGISLEQTVATLAVFADQGIKAELAASQFSIVMRDLQTKAITNAAAFKQFGLEVFDAGGNLKDVSDIVANLEQVLEGESAEGRKSILLSLGFTDKSVGALQKLIGTSDKIAQFTEELRGAGGAIDDVANRALTELDVQLNQLTGTWDRFNVAIGPDVIHLASEALEDVQRGVQSVLETMRTIRDYRSGNITFFEALDEIAGDKVTPAQEVIENTGFGDFTPEGRDAARAERIRQLGPAQLPGFKLGGDGASLLGPAPAASESESSETLAVLRDIKAELQRLNELTPL